MSGLALAVVLGYIAIFGAVREPDEGAAAHLWQLLMVGQIPVIGWFLLTRLKTSPRQAIVVLAVQIAAIVAAAAPVALLGL
jgi:hypothetical protein